MTAHIAVDERAHRAAIKAAIEVSISPWFAYGYDDVPGLRGADGKVNAAEQPPIYVLLSVERRFADVNIRAGAARGVNAVRLSTRVVGRTEDEAAWARKKVSEALEENILTISSIETTPFWFENEEPIQFDDGRYSGLTRWTYQH